MLDKLCKKILKLLIELCSDSSYSIIEITEILVGLGGKVDVELLMKYITHMSNNQYIDVKYIDDKQVCLAIMPKAKGLDEENKNKKKATNKYLRMAIIMAIISAISGFVGAFLGSYFFEILR